MTVRQQPDEYWEIHSNSLFCYCHLDNYPHNLYHPCAWVFLSVCMCQCALFWPDSLGKRGADMRRCEALPCDIPWHLLLSSTHKCTHHHSPRTHTLHPPFIQSAVLDRRTPDGKFQERKRPASLSEHHTVIEEKIDGGRGRGGVVDRVSKWS